MNRERPVQGLSDPGATYCNAHKIDLSLLAIIVSIHSNVRKLVIYLTGMLADLHFFPQHFVRSCSHVICGKPSRGEKFLCGCASGRVRFYAGHAVAM